MNIKNLGLDYIRYKQFNWYGHVWRMYEERLSQKKMWSDVHLEKEEKEELKIRGCKM
jgi:hypothetical protein